MKHLFFVAVAFGIFSGTSISAEAQTSVNKTRLNDGLVKQSPNFIEGIEIRRERPVSVKPVEIGPVPTITDTRVVKPLADEFGATIENCSPIQFKYAQLMNSEVEAISNFTLYNFIETWWGTRYKYGGKTKKGVDCSAYTGALLNEVFKTTVPRTAREQYASCDKISREHLQEGDLVFFNTRGGISHVGVYLGNGYFTHSSVGNGVTISNLDEDYYSRKYIGGGRINTVAAAEEAD